MNTAVNSPAKTIMIRLQEVKEEDRTLLWNINQKYLYEMTNYYNDPMDDAGNYHYGYFEEYFTDPQRKAYFIYNDDTLTGFAMINPYSYINQHPDHVMAEFTIFPAYRGNRYALTAAQLLLQMHPGKWEIKYNGKNTAAKILWNKIAGPHNPAVYHLSEEETVLAFETPESTL